MSTIKSSDEHLTLNADGSSKDIKFQANGVEKASISSSGAFTSTTIDATKLTGDVPDASFPSTLPAASAANLTAIPAANLTGTLPAISGANLTNIDGGKVLQVVKGGISNVSTHAAGSSTYETIYNVSMSNVVSTSTILGFVMWQGYMSTGGADFTAFVFRGSTSIGGGTAADSAASALIVNRRETDANTSFHANGQFEDTGHGGGSLTYAFKVMNEGTMYLGRPSQSGATRHGRGQNNMILMEIGA